MCFWPVTFKKGGLKFWAKFLEKFGMPHAIGKLPPNAKDDERKELLDALKQMVQDTAAIIPNDATVELLEMGNVGESSDSFEKYVRYHDGQISTVILGHSAAVTSTPGKLGNENMAAKVRADIIDCDAEMICDSFDRLIGWIYKLNPSFGEDKPRFVLYSETEIDADRAKRDCNLMATGQVKLTKRYFTRHYDYEDEDIIVPPAA